MDKSKKTKFKNAAEIIGGGIGLGTVAIVAAALEPVVGLVRSGKRLAKQKEENGEIRTQDIKKALEFYGKHLLAPMRLLKEGTKVITDDVTERNQKLKALTPEMLQKTGVADLIKLIEHAPSIKRGVIPVSQFDFIEMGDLFVTKQDDECCVATGKFITNNILSQEKVLLTFPKIYFDFVDDMAIKRIKQLKQQEKDIERSTFASEVAKLVDKYR